MGTTKVFENSFQFFLTKMFIPFTKYVDLVRKGEGGFFFTV